MVRFQNGSVSPSEVVDTQGAGKMLAKDVPIGTFCWKVGNRRYFGMFERCLGQKV